MAGDWIKVQHTTPDKPEVFAVAEALQIDPDAVTGKLLRLWIWADQQTTDGNAASVTFALLDRVAGQRGFADALVRVGWLQVVDGGVVFSNFERHNGDTAKKRAQGLRRVGKHRACNADTVTQTPETEESCNAASVTKTLQKRYQRREEKRREEEINTQTQAPAKPGRVVFVKPQVHEVIAYTREIGSMIDGKEFCDFYESKGWRVGNSPMKDWRAALRQWESRRKKEREAASDDRAQRAGFTAQARQDAQWSVFREFNEAAARDDERERQRAVAGGESSGTVSRISNNASLFGEEQGTDDTF